MFMHSWNVKVLIAVGLIIVQVIIFMAMSSRGVNGFSIPSFIICSLPGIIGALILFIERERGRF